VKKNKQTMYTKKVCAEFSSANTLFPLKFLMKKLIENSLTLHC